MPELFLAVQILVSQAESTLSFQKRKDELQKERKVTKLCAKEKQTTISTALTLISTIYLCILFNSLHGPDSSTGTLTRIYVAIELVVTIAVSAATGVSEKMDVPPEGDTAKQLVRGFLVCIL